jgi:hypothetical protein
MKTKLLIVINTLILMASISINAQTVQSRTFTFTEASHASTYNGNAQHVLAVWIEQGSGSSGTFIVTKFKYVGGGTSDHLPTWASKASAGVTTTATSTSCNTTTATTGATLSAWSTKTVTWDGKNAAGTLVADGNYQFVVQSTWNHGTTGTAIRYFPFVKGPGATNPTFIDDANYTGITAILSSPSFSIKPEVSIYPSPTNGILNMDFKNEVNNIRIINILGKVVYNEKVTEDLTNGNKRIDLTNLVGGIYIVSVSNDNGTSITKVVLNK